MEPTSAAQRVAAQQRQMQGKIIQCERCGSSYFKTIKIMRYTRGYGSVETQPDAGSQEFELIECLCGYPVAPLVPAGRKAAGVYEGAHKEMRESVKFAQDHVKTFDAAQAAQDVLNAAAGKHVEGQVDLIQERLTILEETVLSPEHEKQDVTVDKPKGKLGRPAKEKEENVQESK